MNWKLWSILGLLGLAVVFTVQNVEVVEIRFLFWRIEMSRALMIFAVLVAGILMGWIGSGLRPRGR